MSAGFSLAINAVPFFELLDQEERSLAQQVLEVENDRAVQAAMDASRRRLARGVDDFVRVLPAVVRNDTNASRAAAYALVGLADERMLHYPAGGLGRWRDRLLEFELYGSALAGQEVVARAQAATQGMATAADGSLLAPLYLAVLREGFEGSLRGDTLAISALIASLEGTVGAVRGATVDAASDTGLSRIGIAPMPLAILGVALWLVMGLALWLMLPSDTLRDAERIAERVRAGLPADTGALEPLQRSVGPSELPPSSYEDAPSAGAETNATDRAGDTD